MFPSPDEYDLAMMPSTVPHGNARLSMSVRCLSAILLVTLMATPAWAEQKTATDKVVDTFMALDTDSNKAVSYGEYKAMVEQRASERFAQMDANHNGEVSADEYRGFWQKEKAQWYRLKR